MPKKTVKQKKAINAKADEKAVRVTELARAKTKVDAAKVKAATARAEEKAARDRAEVAAAQEKAARANAEVARAARDRAEEKAARARAEVARADKEAARARAEVARDEVAAAEDEVARARAEVAAADKEAARARAKVARAEVEAVRVAALAQQEAAKARAKVGRAEVASAEEEADRARDELAAAEEEAARARDIMRQHVLYDEVMTSRSSTFSKMKKLYVNEFESSNSYRDKRHNWKWDKGYLSCRVFRQPRLSNNPISSYLSFQLPGNFTQLKMDMGNIFGFGKESELRRIMKFGNTSKRDKYLKKCYQEVGWDKNVLGRGTSKGLQNRFAFTTKPSSPMHVTFMDMNVQLAEVAYSATCVYDYNEPIKYNITLKFQMADYFSIKENFEDSRGNVVSYPKFSLEVNYHVSHDPNSSLSGEISSRLDDVEENETKRCFSRWYKEFRNLKAPKTKEFIVSSGKYKMRFDKDGNLIITGIK